VYWRTDLQVPRRPYTYSGAKHAAHGQLLGDRRELFRLEAYLRARANGDGGDPQMESPDQSLRLADALSRFLRADYSEPVGRPDLSGRNSEIGLAYWALVLGAKEKQEVANRAISERLKSLGLELAPQTVARIARNAVKDRAGEAQGRRARGLRARLAYERRDVFREAPSLRRHDAYWVVAAWALSIVEEDLAYAADWSANRPVAQPAPKR